MGLHSTPDRDGMTCDLTHGGHVTEGRASGWGGAGILVGLGKGRMCLHGEIVTQWGNAGLWFCRRLNSIHGEFILTKVTKKYSCCCLSGIYFTFNLCVCFVNGICVI